MPRNLALEFREGAPAARIAAVDDAGEGDEGGELVLDEAVEHVEVLVGERLPESRIGPPRALRRES